MEKYTNAFGSVSLNDYKGKKKYILTYIFDREEWSFNALNFWVRFEADDKNKLIELYNTLPDHSSTLVMFVAFELKGDVYDVMKL